MIINKNHILFNLDSVSQTEAIQLVGNKMVSLNFCDVNYVQSMLEKCKAENTYIGNGIAIPHSKDVARKFVIKTGIVVAHFPNGIIYDNETVHLVIGIASNSDEHINILQDLAIKLSDEDYVKKLVSAVDIDKFYNIFVE